ncbi:putative integral membrane protein [Aminobacter sp. MSH1]|nr:putative integral membrane protein [Aminobacter sp. MSH1]
MSRFTSVEARIDAAAHAVLDRLPAGGFYGALVEFLVFGLKQAWACLFGGAMLALIMATRLWWPADAGLTRYDFLFLAAVAIQVAMLALRLEKPSEAKVILIFHVVGTVMEVFKTSAGSWIYPEENLFRIAGVPLFSGFMYAAVGSYLARVSRIFDMRYTGYPPLWATVLLCAAIYVNFFAHHFTIDIRYGLFAATALLYLTTVVHYRVFRFRHRMPLLLGFLLVALFIWLAENIGTWSRAWIYPGQHDGWTPVSIQKLGSWYLLMIISFVLVTLVHRPRPMDTTPGSKAVELGDDVPGLVGGIDKVDDVLVARRDRALVGEEVEVDRPLPK